MVEMVGQAQNVQVPNYSGVNIQIFNPSVAAPGGTATPSNISAPTYSTNPSYPANYYTQSYAPPMPAPVAATSSDAAKSEEKKKTEKRDIVQLTDDYVRTIEGYLNDQNKEIRLMGAKEVLARLQEDDSRKNDPALNALVNKMLQDPSSPVRFIAMAALESKAVDGNEKTVALLKGIQQKKTYDGEDSLKASNILLKMSGTTVKKEFEVQDKPKKESEKK